MPIGNTRTKETEILQQALAYETHASPAHKRSGEAGGRKVICAYGGFVSSSAIMGLQFLAHLPPPQHSA